MDGAQQPGTTSEGAVGVPEGRHALYPSHWEADVVLRDGVPMHIRPIRPGDSAALQELHLRQSERSVYFRFFAPLQRIPDRDLHRYTNVDHRDRVALVLTRAGHIVAVGNYERIDDRTAEVAFYVDDSEHGRGLGSVLLEHLAAAARERGITHFSAEVLPTNTRMLAVFRDAGYAIAQRLDDGVIHVELALEETPTSWSVMAEREQHAESLSMRTLLRAAGVLVADVGGAQSELAARAATALLGDGYRGRVWLVGDRLAGIASPVAVGCAGAATPARVNHVGSLAEVRLAAGETVDLAVLAGGPEAVVAAVDELYRLSVPGLVVLSGGFAESGPQGEQRQDALLRRTRTAGMRLLGPASFGLVSETGETGRLNVTLHPGAPAGELGVFSQSAASTASLVGAARRRGLGTRSVVSAGNRADISGNDTMQAWLDDPDVRVAALALESIGNPRKFSRVSRRLSATRPVIVLISEQTGLATLPGHAVRTSERAPEALSQMLDQAGVLRVRNQRELLDLAQFFAHQQLPAGDRLAVLANSPTLAALLAGGPTGFAVVPDLPALPLAATLQDYEVALRQLRERQDWDAALLVYVDPGGDPEVGEQVACAAADLDRPVVAVVAGLRPGLGRRGVPCYDTVEDAMAVLQAGRRLDRWRSTERGELLEPAGIDPAAARALVRPYLADLPVGTRRRLPAETATAVLRQYGIEVLASRRVSTEAEALAAAEELGWPVAVKSTDDLLRHRADLGGVRLDVHTPAELRDVVATMSRASGTADGVLEIQAMAPTGAACVIRGAEDQLLGPVLSFGLGGDAVELLGDVSHRIPPLTSADVADMVRSVRASPRLLGHRGLPRLDLEALEALLARVSVLIDDLPEIAEIVINPALVAACGVTVLSVTVDVAHPVRADGGRRVLPAPARSSPSRGASAAHDASTSS